MVRAGSGTGRRGPATAATSASDVAAVLRSRQPGLSVKKLHKLLYYCQGHHLAAFGEPLFREGLSAWNMGPVVGTLWRREKDGVPPPPSAELTDAGLDTIDYVLSRYGRLTGHDLENLTHTEAPWRRADRTRPPGGSAPIELGWLRDYFSTDGAPDDDLGDPAWDAALADRLAGAEQRHSEPRRTDSRDEIRRRLSTGA